MIVPSVSRAEATAQELKRYFTGKPCKHGHICERYTRSKICVECCVANRKKWGEEYPEKVRVGIQRWVSQNEQKRRAASKAWRINNPEKKKAANEKWARGNPEKIRESQRKHYARNLEKQRERSRLNHAARREEEKETSRLYRKKFPERKRASEAKRRAQMKCSSAVGSYSPQDIREIRDLQGNRCAYCRVKLRGSKFHIDHIKPLAREGSNDRKNLQLTCARCNISKGAKDPIEFAKFIGKLI
ncbi:MAG: HNH endonuclease [Mesorhizobium sp.]|nr:MAG: HNH endonuclease [Mesorhizobium sp.]